MNGAARLRLAAALVAGVAAASPALAQERRLLVIISRARPETDISQGTLARVFRGEAKFWGNERIVVLMPPTSTGEDLRRKFLERVVKLGTRDFELAWRERVFRGEAVRDPLSLPDDRAVANAVFASRHAIGLVEADKVPHLDKVVRVLTVDGKAPEAADYPLRW